MENLPFLCLFFCLSRSFVPIRFETFVWKNSGFGYIRFCRWYATYRTIQLWSNTRCWSMVSSIRWIFIDAFIDEPRSWTATFYKSGTFIKFLRCHLFSHRFMCSMSCTIRFVWSIITCAAFQLHDQNGLRTNIIFFMIWLLHKYYITSNRRIGAMYI